MFIKQINGDFIESIGEGNCGTAVSEEEYNEILGAMHSRPTPPEGYDYCLRADTLEWELVELPPIFSNDNEDKRI